MIDRYGGSGLIDLVKVSEDSYDLVRDMELYVGHIILSYYDEIYGFPLKPFRVWKQK